MVICRYDASHPHVNEPSVNPVMSSAPPKLLLTVRLSVFSRDDSSAWTDATPAPTAGRLSASALMSATMIRAAACALGRVKLIVPLSPLGRTYNLGSEYVRLKGTVPPLFRYNERGRAAQSARGP